ncbi:MAG: hypothetical protein JRG67_16100 [Deltaproteobacteria bacterium]|nr:hypothetical protein [Deltaproteobacteria bacterium]MBW2212528.1 hypothetical protein [Deltaproteobacteria bacterium]MBW2381179.1 hypothetical protein [Deltaproteobacteria bacterium]MBW2628690.1 hypothetical protein [Deltaproteobacteria bacterium]MBW2686563.1 hypothetical protein [Deltaproteobacteria bacterium]
MEPRELGGVERMNLALDRIATMNFTTIARVRGRFDDGQLRHALDALARRHPTLTARVCRKRFRWYLEPNTVHSIGSRQIDADPQAWVSHAEAETQHQTWRLDGPRARCIWLRHGEADSTLLLTFHHVISDGKSGVLVMRDLIRLLADPSLELPEIPTASLESFFPLPYRPSQNLSKAFGLLARDMRATPATQLPSDGSAPIEERTQRVVPMRFTEAQTTALRNHARREGYTMHGLLSSAMMLALYDTGEWTDEPTMRLFHALDFRVYLEQLRHRSGGDSPRIGEASGIYASYVDTEHRLSSATELHALGRDVTGQIQSQKADGIPFLTSPFSGRLIPWMRASLGPKRTLRLCESQLTRRSLAVTNLGLLERLDVQERYRGLEIEELHFFAAVSVMGPLGATVSTFRNRLQLNLGYVEPGLGRATMERFQHHLMRRLDAFDS